MKSLRQLEDRILTAVMVVALMVPLVLVAISQSNKPTLSFEGARIQVVEDGSVQLLFDVCIKNVPMTTGAQFTLGFDPRYILPSDYTSNTVLKNRSSSIPALHKNPDLYWETVGGQLVPVDPFAAVSETSTDAWVRYGGDKGTVSMVLFTNGELVPGAGSGMTSVEAAEGTNNPLKRNVFDASKKLVLGTLSFRVVDTDLLPEITRKFDGLTDVLLDDNHAKSDPTDKLIYFSARANRLGNDPWGIGLCLPGESHGYEFVTWNDANNDEKAQATFTYKFPKTIIKARAAEAELTLNAYQVYNDGHVSDVDTALQKYSPAITVTYSDGSQGNFIMPWGRVSNAVDSDGNNIVVDSGGNVVSALPWAATVVTDRNDVANRVVKDTVTDAAKEIQYDPTASRYKAAQGADQHYLVEKGFCYEEYGEAKTFPVPIQVNLTVTPITLVDVTANDLHKSYILNDELVDSDSKAAVQSLGALRLPTQARLVTDVPAGGVTLTMDIPGWSNEQTQQDGTKLYWPSDDTGSTMDKLWKDGAVDDPSAADVNAGAYLHWPTAVDKGKFVTVPPATEPVREANGVYLGTNRAGRYTFMMAESYGGEPTAFTKANIQAAYPWLTVPEPEYPLENATRRIVWNGEPKANPDDPDKPELVDTAGYQVTYVSTATNAANSQPDLTLQVKRVNGTAVGNLMKDSVFRIRLPDGTELGTGYTDDTVTLSDWFGSGANGSYTTQENMNVDPDFPNNRRGFDLTTNPGNPTTGVYGDEREKLRRYINLGGWFSVAVKEIEKDESDAVTGETLWSDFIPVYVPPRDNYYTESKVYNFIGENAGLYPWPGGLSTTVILPPGTYEPVMINAANSIVPVYTDSTNTVRATERYGVTTTYDGATGAQPGRLHTFTIDPVPTPAPNDDWRTSGPVDLTAGDGTTRRVTTYGSEVFLDSAFYNAYGKVLNRLTDRNSINKTYAADAYTATVRTEELAEDTLLEEIVLEYVSTSGGERSINTVGPNVSAVIYGARVQGYTMRQDYTLAIRNIGNVDINGLSIDTLTDLMGNSAYNKGLDVGGGHFEILKPPASFLPAGESTTFVLTYVYDLRALGSSTMDYRDKLFITSNRKDKTGDGCVAGTDYLLDFDAQFQVTSQDIHRVFVNVVPEGGLMGTAGVIVGPVQDSSSNTTLNTSAGTTAFPAGLPVYIMVTPTDEYERYTVTAEDSTGSSVSIDLYTPPAGTTLPQGVEIYTFEMPDYDTTVTVKFEEPIRSKLRLSDLRVYADQTDDNLYPKNGDWNDKDSDNYKANYQQVIWQKRYTEAEEAEANTHASSNDGKNLSLMTMGTADKPGFDSQVEQYLTVIPADADWAQVEVDLRKVLFLEYGNQPLTNINVQMLLYETTDINVMQTGGRNIYPQTAPGYQTGETNGPTSHTSIPFEAPEPGTSKYVRVRLQYTETMSTSRYYYIEIHRAPVTVSAELNYGNSPYGMIMNDSSIAAADKNTAKREFVNNNYSFSGLATGVPSVVTENGLADLHYWIEAWAPPTETWTPPNADWITPGAVYDDETGMREALYHRLSGWRYDAAAGKDVIDTSSNHFNLDLNDYAFFATMGEAFRDPGLAWAIDSSGRRADLTKAKLSLTAYTLDNSAGVDSKAPGGQLDRFSLPADPDALKARTVTFGFLNAGNGADAVSGDTVTGDWAQWYLTPTGELTQEPAAGNTLLELRPGRYKLTYTFPDYNFIPNDPVYGDKYLSVERDLVVLAPVGDVNADLTAADTTDKALLEGRISPNAGRPALGYMADNYDHAAIFKLRTCDVNNDRNINNIDANTIDRSSRVERFYLPVDYKPAGTP